MTPERFEAIYQVQAPWDIGEPQPDVVHLEESGDIRGVVLDVGCGSGENALYLTSRGHEVWGIDFVPMIIERARSKALERKLGVHFQVGDALNLDVLGRTFDTVIDCGLFHTFNDEERPLYVRSLASVVKPEGMVHILCFSDEEPPGEGPRRVSEQELRDAFKQGWQVESIRPSRFKTAMYNGAPQFSPGGPKCWIASIRRSEMAR